MDGRHEHEWGFVRMHWRAYRGGFAGGTGKPAIDLHCECGESRTAEVTAVSVDRDAWSVQYLDRPGCLTTVRVTRVSAEPS